MTRRRRVWALLLAPLLVVAACSSSDLELERADPSTTTTTEPSSTTATGPTTAPTAPVVSVPELAWDDCGGRGECTTFPAPVDYDDPAGPTIDLFARRIPATGDRLGALFVNFGGPGADAASMLASFSVPDRITERFDLVGLDPRGVGGSTPLDCGLDSRTLYSLDPTIEDRADVDALLAVSNEYVDDCRSDGRDVLPHLGTRNVARDMDLLRAALGDERLHYVGYSYGTSIGQVYAELFPTRIGGMILDGVVDTGQGGIAGAVGQAEGSELALRNWAEGCDRRRSCDLDDPLSAVDEVLARAERGIPAPDGRMLGPGEMAVGLAYPLYNESFWGRLDAGITRALEGDGGGMLALADAYMDITDFSIYFAVSCLDSTWPRSPGTFLEEAEKAGEITPRFGEAIVNDYIRCALWPAEPDPLGPIDAAGAPPILVVSGTGDPATPYENGVTVADRLDSGVLLTYDGEGHTITFQGSSCIDGLVIDYLVEGIVPDDGTVC